MSVLYFRPSASQVVNKHVFTLSAAVQWFSEHGENKPDVEPGMAKH